MSSSLKPRDAIKSLLDAGYDEVNVRGGKHRKFYHVRANHWVVIPHSPKGDILYGNMAKTVRQAVEKARRQ